jgi:uncharacterized iron-regulated protein
LPADAIRDLEVAESYAVIPDSTKSLAPKVKPLTSAAVVRDLADRKRQAIFLGEHHNAAADHRLQAALIRELHGKRSRDPMAVGLEAVQSRFQPVLDDFIAGRIDEAELEASTEWKKRWFWPFER